MAYSLAGHDKGEVYLIVEETKDFVYVANGTVRTVDKPKKRIRGIYRSLRMITQGLRSRL